MVTRRALLRRLVDRAHCAKLSGALARLRLEPSRKKRAALCQRIIAFGERYSSLDQPFAWTFTRSDLERKLRDSLLSVQPATLATAA